MNETVLIIDDNTLLLENIEEILALAGYNVIRAENGSKGIGFAQKLLPDLILCDIVMPDLDGYSVLHAIQNTPSTSRIPFVFITSKGRKSDFRKGMNLGSDDYLVKPFNGAELLEMVETRLNKNKIYKKENKIEAEFEKHRMKEATANSLESLLTNRKSRRVKKNEMIFIEGDGPCFLYYLQSGKVKTYKRNNTGKEYITQLFQSGEFFGYINLLNDSQYGESAMAIENTELVQVPREDFYCLIFSNSEISRKFIKIISNNISDVEDRMVKLAYDSARQRMADALILLYNKYCTREDENSFPAHRENISAIAGISPESVSRNLSDFKKEGIIETDHKMIRVMNFTKLQNIR